MSGGDGYARSAEREGEEGMWSGDELHDLITIKLTQRRSVSPATFRKLSEAFNPLALIPARDDLIVQGVKASSCLLLLNGFAARYRLLRNGRRQFTEICLPGDFVNLGWLLARRTSTFLQATSPVARKKERTRANPRTAQASIFEPADGRRDDFIKL
ncbi:cyclic nucleotide-binding domain-containing protein [Brevundimonas naejangsanensis]|uniref:cyclic nucleotide-binding domain-containing protein n=1 Tax=Brevundimonas naejangsanensis TaxID=588932 RepID=UPI0039F65FB3